MKEVLVVEDSKTINKIIKNKLSSMGLNVDTAYTLSEAEKLIGEKGYELIILDLHLPDGEGSELIMDLQALTKAKVIVLTSTKDETLREELFRHGILDYIVKDTNLLYSVEEIVNLINKIKTTRKDKILIIDDSKFICRQVKRILEPRNYHVKEAHTAKEGLKLLKEEEFNLLVLDMELPDMHGKQVLEKLRSEPRFIELPVIVLSGTIDADTVRHILKHGANDYLRKPFIFEEFVLRVDLWVDYHKQKKELKDKQKELEEINKSLQEKINKAVEENRRKDRMLLAQARLAQMGEIISMIAHQWKQPLNTLSASINKAYLRYKLGKLDGDVFEDCYNQATKQIDYMSQTLRDFMNFFKPNRSKEAFNLSNVIEKVVDMVKPVLERHHINVIKEINENITIEGYPNELAQVIVNLINNAKDAFVQRDIKGNRLIKIYSKERGQKIILHVEDNAGGIPQEIISKVFDAYFSTKSKEGTGLGLYIAKVVVEDHMGGRISVENTKAGSLFKIEFPIT